MKCRFGLLLLCLLFLFNINNVKALSCDEADIERLKGLAESVTYNYEYVGDDFDYQNYDISFDNLEDNFYIKDSEGTIVYKNLVKLSVKSGNRSFKVYSSDCDVSVRTINVNLPKFNLRYLSDDCNGLEDELDVCGKWYQGSISDEDFDNIINEYNEKYYPEDKDIITSIINFIVDYYYFVGIGILILIIVIILLVIRHRKRSRLD